MALWAATVAVAVTVDPLIPKLTLLELENTTWSEMLLEVVPAEKLSACLAVMVEPASPKLTRLESLKTTDPRLLEVVPAEKFTGAAAAVPADTVMVMDPPLVDPLRVTLAPPASRSCPVTIPVSPEVLPWVENPAV
jgi:hypothetical protein